jgi:tetratricopeptide (TPR) repeat protein
MERRRTAASLKLTTRKSSVHVSAFSVLAIIVLLVSSPSLCAQQQQDTTPPWPMHDSSPRHATADVGGDLPLLIQPDDSCLLWTEGKTDAATVSAANLKAPPAAHDEYKKACVDLKAKHFGDAEAHVRKAIDLDSNYPGAWALLGQVLEASQKFEDAKTACSQATSVDAAYSPAYLCLSDLAAQNNDWQASLDFADRSLTLDPIQNAYGHFYTAIAQVHLGQVSQAQSSALDAVDADHQHRVPQVHLLLAQIYGSQGDLKSAAEQLRTYLKVAHNPADAADVKKSLAQLNSQISK